MNDMNNTKIKNFYKKNRLIITCVLTSIPIIILGILAMIFLYEPVMKWQIDARKWLLPLFIVIYCLIVEFILVAVPCIMLFKNKKSKNIEQKKDCTPKNN